MSQIKVQWQGLICSVIHLFHVVICMVMKMIKISKPKDFLAPATDDELRCFTQRTTSQVETELLRCQEFTSHTNIVPSFWRTELTVQGWDWGLAGPGHGNSFWALARATSKWIYNFFKKSVKHLEFNQEVTKKWNMIASLILTLTNNCHNTRKI